MGQKFQLKSISDPKKAILISFHQKIHTWKADTANRRKNETDKQKAITRFKASSLFASP